MSPETASPRSSTDGSVDNSPRISFGLTGHRPERLGMHNLPAVRREIDLLLASVEAQFPQFPPRAFRLVTALAEGADAIGAEVALARGWRLDLILPFSREDYIQDFSVGAPRENFERDLARAGSVLELDGSLDKGTESQAYERAGRVMLSQIDVLIAVWDGGPSRGPGGAPQVIAEAVLEGIPVVHLYPGSREPAQLLWDGLTEVDLGRQSLDTVARAGIAALPALLTTIIITETDNSLAIGRFERLKERRWTVMLAYPLMLALLGVRGLRRTDFGHPSAGDDSGAIDGRSGIRCSICRGSSAALQSRQRGCRPICPSFSKCLRRKFRTCRCGGSIVTAGTRPASQL